MLRLRAYERVSCASRVFPIPASPWITTRPPRPRDTSRTRAGSRSSSSARPTTTRQSIGATLRVGYWEDVVRSGDWPVGGALPMALGVETAGTVTAVGSAVTTFGIGDEVLTHCVPSV